MQHPSSSAMPGQAQVRGTHQLTAEILSAVNSQGMSLGPSRRDPARRSRLDYATGPHRAVSSRPTQLRVNPAQAQLKLDASLKWQ